MSALLEDYIRLWKHSKVAGPGSAVRLTVPELAEIWICTDRHVKSVLNKMIGAGWIRYASGRGRGHVSELTLLVSPFELAQQEAQHLVVEGQVEAALALIRQSGDDPGVKMRFVRWMSDYFGYRVESLQGTAKEILRTPVLRSVVTLEPAEAFFSFDFHVIRQFYDTLVEYDRRTGQFAGSLAHHWSHDGTARQWTFYLRKGVYFHNGARLDAGDVVYSLLRLKEGGFLQSWLMEGVHEIEAVSENAVRFDLREPNHGFLHFISHTPASILPREQGTIPVSPGMPIGTGPFQWVRQNRGMLVLDAFERHFRGRPYLDRVEIFFVPEWTEQMPPPWDSGLPLVHTGDAGTERYVSEGWKDDAEYRYEGVSMLTLNMKKPGPLQDPLFRQALARLIDRRKLVDDLGGLRVSPSPGLRAGELQAKDDPAFRPEEGLEALHKSSYRGETLTLYCVERHSPDADWLKRWLMPFGIQLKVKIVDWSGLTTQAAVQAADFILFEWVLSEGPIRLVELYRSDHSFLRVCLPEDKTAWLDLSLKRLWTESLPEEPADTFRDMEDELLRDFCMIGLARKTSTASFHPSWRGIRINAHGWVDFKDVWSAGSVNPS